jgi:hypothetical protein
MRSPPEERDRLVLVHRLVQLPGPGGGVRGCLPIPYGPDQAATLVGL